MARGNVVRQLVLKDLRIMRGAFVGYCAGGLVALAIVMFGGEALGMAGVILFVTAIASAGIHAVMATVVEERQKQTLPFIMSLPVTVRQYTSAKILANLLLFGLLWLTLSAATYIVYVGDSLPHGSIPFLTIVNMGILLAFVIILTVALVGESTVAAIAGVVLGNIGTQMYLWIVVDLYGIRSVIGGSRAVWTPTAVGILTTQAVLALVLVAATFVIQSRKTDFL